MEVVLSKRADRQLDKAPKIIQGLFFKQAGLLEIDRIYPSLHAKKYSESKDIWQARINRDWRFYFKITNDTYLIFEIIHHPK